MKYVSILFCGDDGIDMDEGYNGNIQFLFVMTGADGHHGAEIDSMAKQVSGNEVVKNVDSQPRTLPKVYNAMFVGSVHGSPQSVSSDDQREALMRIREGAGGEWANIVLANVAKVGLLQTSCGAEIRSHEIPEDTNEYLFFSSNNIIDSIYLPYGFVEFYELEDTDGFNSCAGLTNATTVDDLMIKALPSTVDEDISFIDPRPVAGSPLLENVDPVPDLDFFDDVDFKGAFAPDAPLWLACWSWLGEFNHIPDCS